MSYSVGDVVSFHNPKFPEETHHHIIVARKDNTWWLVVGSSRPDHVRQRCAYLEGKKIADQLDTYIQLPPNTCPLFPNPTGINCNAVFEHNLLELSQKEEYDFSARDGNTINKEHLFKILTAICRSKTVNPSIKLLCDPTPFQPPPKI